MGGGGVCRTPCCSHGEVTKTKGLCLSKDSNHSGLFPAMLSSHQL